MDGTTLKKKFTLLEEDETRLKQLAQNQAWLMSLIEANFYGDCEHHPLITTNFFCTLCMGHSICEQCKTHKHSTHDNKVLKVSKTSRQVSVRLDELIKVGLEKSAVFDLPKYSMNCSKVIFINQRGNRGKEARSNGIGIHTNCQKCEHCGFVLITSSTSPTDAAQNYRFCSIECLFKTLMGHVENNGIERRDQMDHQQVVDVPKPRRRRRKGIPKRAPFF